MSTKRITCSLSMSNNNSNDNINHSNKTNHDNFEDDDFGDDSFLLNFDIEEAIAKSRRQQQGSSSQRSPQQKHTNNVHSARSAKVQNPYAKNTNKDTRVRHPSYARKNSSGNSIAVETNHNKNVFGENSKFSFGGVDNTQYMDIDNNNHRSHPQKRTSHQDVESFQTKKQKQSIQQDNISPKSVVLPKVIPTPRNTIDKKVDPTSISKYTSTLETHFGYKSFRTGQLPIIHSIIHEKHDVTVFWSTGSGKSLCYQIPPLHMNKIAIIVSPLISLMEDQVSKLNGLLNSNSLLASKEIASAAAATSGDENFFGEKKKKDDIAVYLGSGQLDQSAEYKALQGAYMFIYVTPEKLLSSGGEFLNALAALHHRKGIFRDDGENICLFAIDER